MMLGSWGLWSSYVRRMFWGTSWLALVCGGNAESLVSGRL
jgi:hypothetical protein